MKHTNSMQRSYLAGKVLTYCLLILGSLIMIFPFVWMVLTSFKTQAESVSIPATFFPSEFRTDGYQKVIDNLPFLKLYWNTILMGILREQGPTGFVCTRTPGRVFCNGTDVTDLVVKEEGSTQADVYTIALKPGNARAVLEVCWEK